MEIRDRIVELRRVKASELTPNPRNWRTHPRAQRKAMQAILEEVGYAGALLARETPAGLELIDGHLRSAITPEETVPVLVLDVTEAEANKILATYDPIAAMAGAEGEKLKAVLDDIDTGSAALQKMLEDLADEHGRLEQRGRRAEAHRRRPRRGLPLPSPPFPRMIRACRRNGDRHETCAGDRHHRSGWFIPRRVPPQ